MMEERRKLSASIAHDLRTPITVMKGYTEYLSHIQTWLMGSWDCGVFTHREIAQRLMDTFTGLKLKELAWFENPREKTLKNGKPRARRAKWLPEGEVDLVYLYSDYYIDAREPTSAQTDFFTVTRMDAWGVSTWFMCTPEAAGKLIAMTIWPSRKPPLWDRRK